MKEKKLTQNPPPAPKARKIKGTSFLPLEWSTALIIFIFLVVLCIHYIFQGKVTLEPGEAEVKIGLKDTTYYWGKESVGKLIYNFKTQGDEFVEINYDDSLIVLRNIEFVSIDYTKENKSTIVHIH